MIARLLAMLVRREAERQVAAIEEACWEAMELGCGVLVVAHPFSAVAHPGVPLANVYHCPDVATREAFEEVGSRDVLGGPEIEPEGPC